MEKYQTEAGVMGKNEEIDLKDDCITLVLKYAI